ncbi:MAG: N-acetylmuramoyl-L-alanine amidase, partial [Hyphomonadaceae bacterium]
MKIEQAPSPNFNDRKAPIDMLVLHYTGMVSGQAALDRMCDAAAEVSAHYLVWEDGRISQLVDEGKRAWHAGIGSWQGDTDLNSCSIGIEIVNGGHNVPLGDGSLPPYPEVQIEAVIALSQSIIARHHIPQARIVGHSDIAPARKEDPGEHFPWAQLSEAGIGLWPEPFVSESGAPTLIGRGLRTGDQGEPVERMQKMLARIGYGTDATGIYDEATEAAVL